MGFTTPSYDLNDLFSRINRGDIQLPDFQRCYSWNEDRIRSLIVSVLRGYPLGTFMALDTRNEKMRFRPRVLSGAPDRNVNPGLLLLDGQQRLTTLYHCFRGDGQINTTDFRSKKISRIYYVDIRKAVSEPLMPDEAVFAVDAKGSMCSFFGPELDSIPDYDAAIAAGVIPVASLLSPEGTAMLFDMAVQSEDLRAEVADFNSRIARPLAGYDIPVIRLSRETEQAGIGQVFAQANSSGLQMGVFELLTSVFASEDPDFHLSKDWEETMGSLRRLPSLESIDRTDFLRAVSLLVSSRKGKAGGNREDILRLSLSEYLDARATLRETMNKVAAFLAQRCILDDDQVPYSAQLVPLAVIFARLLEHPEVLEVQDNWDKINQWFWCGVFGELYGSGAVAQRASRDVDEVLAWVLGKTDTPPKTVRDASFQESRLLSAGPKTGVFKAFYALLMARGAKDWRTGTTFNQDSFEDFQPGFFPVFPLRWCNQQGIDPVLAHSVMNYTPMGKRTEVVLDGKPPQRYLRRVQAKSIMEDPEFDAVLASHEIDPELIHTDAFERFIRDRRERFIGMVEYAMGKEVIRDVDEDNLGGGAEGPDAFA
ncbi:hypothetical protein CPHO_06965 [Corynebacterium phocae]|uniref:GmrSD restriction endonucleases N-terminal domain-containing protein n=1 Tax=Corynebacterium phocae TaxID=161895 RepID=A0A1L7D3J5_9CORY|nr:DUF262 domain-containing protein [Corynebacterium phocae]APT92675.1 hypothetical protein CPHO_06965 [Corynebacterium phocae]KAA8723564.1 DUF262 domain-containing protein [Corynebacterium phocae]